MITNLDLRIQNIGQGIFEVNPFLAIISVAMTICFAISSWQESLCSTSRGQVLFLAFATSVEHSLGCYHVIIIIILVVATIKWGPALETKSIGA